MLQLQSRVKCLLTGKAELAHIVHVHHLDSAALLQEKYPGVAFAKADTTAESIEPLIDELGVKILPTFKFYAGGKEVAQPISGYKKGPLEDAIKQLAK